VYGDPVRLDVLVRRRDPKQLSGVNAFPHDPADNNIAFGDLHRDLVSSRGCDLEDFRRPLHPLPIQADAWNWGLCATKSSAMYSSKMLQSLDSFWSIAST
jgi:hypothetical protein